MSMMKKKKYTYTCTYLWQPFRERRFLAKTSKRWQWMGTTLTASTWSQTFYFYGYCFLWRRRHNVVLLNKWVSVTVKYERPLTAEFCPMFVVLGFCFFRNIFGRSTLSDDFFELLRMLLGILIGDQPFFRCSLLFVSEYYR